MGGVGWGGGQLSSLADALTATLVTLCSVLSETLQKPAEIVSSPIEKGASEVKVVIQFCRISTGACLVADEILTALENNLVLVPSSPPVARTQPTRY